MEQDKYNFQYSCLNDALNLILISYEKRELLK